MADTDIWAEIQFKYEKLGKKPRELAKEYNIETKSISNKAHHEKWKKPKINRKKIVEKLSKNYDARIDYLFAKALNIYEEVLDSIAAEYSDKLKAADSVAKLSGKLIQKQEVTTNIPQIVVANETVKSKIEMLMDNANNN